MVDTTSLIIIFSIIAVIIIVFCFIKPTSKIMYWIFIAWWLKPIKNYKKRKIEKMQEEITKAKYEKLQEQKQEENKKSAK